MQVPIEDTVFTSPTWRWDGHASGLVIQALRRSSCEGQTQYLLPQSIGLTEPTTPTRVGELTKVLKGEVPPQGLTAFPFIYHV